MKSRNGEVISATIIDAPNFLTKATDTRSTRVFQAKVWKARRVLLLTFFITLLRAVVRDVRMMHNVLIGSAV